MPRGKRNDGPPPGARKTSSGRITLTIPYQGQRLSQNKIKPDEPKSYADNTEARAGYERVIAYIAAEVDNAATVMGFWLRWTDEDDPEFGAGGIETPRRSTHAVYTYKSHTRKFAERYAERTVASLTEKDIKVFMGDKENYRPSSMPAIRTFLEDARKAGLRSGENPALRLTKLAQAKMAKARVDRPPVPTAEQSAAMLAHMREHDYPLALYGWFLTGTVTGMRGSEIDGMQLRYLDWKTGEYDIQWQLHPRTRVLDVPKHGSRRKVLLTPEVLDVIRTLHPVHERPVHPDADYIWLNTFGLPWEDSSRGKWWEKEIGGTSLRALAGGVTMYNATRHYWATRAVNDNDMTLWHAAILFGHSDGGKLIASTYARKDEDSALDAARAMNAQQNRKQIRRAA